MDTGCTLPEAWVLGNEELLYILPAPMHTLYSGSQRGPTVQEEKGLVLCRDILQRKLHAKSGRGISNSAR